ncbi:MAG: hypothetical protein ACJ757_08515 [Gaiellaceae bacterium]
MAKLQREQSVREKRARKQERKDEKKQAAAQEAYLLANPPEPVDEELVAAPEKLVAESD